MATLRIYIWEGDGISCGYHDDGTLVVLAESEDAARALVRAKQAEVTVALETWGALPERRTAPYPIVEDGWDGTEEALDRPPDRIVEVDKPAWVAFNGGGYD